MSKPSKKSKGTAPPQSLREAIDRADVDAIRAFVANGEALNQRFEIHGDVPLHAAVDAATGEPDDRMPAVADLLIELGADVNHRASAYQPPALFWAAYRGLDALCRLFVSRGASVDGTDHGDEHTMLHCAVEGGLLWLAERCVAAGIDPNAETSQGHRAIHYAFTRGSLHPGKDWEALAELLSRAGAALGVNNGSWGTALHWAATHRRASAVPWLVERGIAVDTPTAEADGRTALMLAAVGRSDGDVAETLRALLALGADVRYATPVTGLTALHQAAWACDMEALRALLEAGADPAAKTRAAASFGSVRVKAGARPIDLARRRKWEAAFSLL
jgi:ankyrin repeat protein